MTLVKRDITPTKTASSLILGVLLRVVLWVLVVAQFLFSFGLILYYVSVWRAPKLDAGFWVEFNKYSEWARLSIADVLLGVLVMPICGWGMLKGKTWAAMAFGIWLIPSIAFNDFRPHYILPMFEFPALAGLLFIFIYYLACAYWERKQRL